MTYGKNQQALLNFLHKHPNRWHKIKRRKALEAARRLSKAFNSCVLYSNCQVLLAMPQILLKQN